MIEKYFPESVANILDYGEIKKIAVSYVEEKFSDIMESFSGNLVLKTMDEEHLGVVAGHVSGNPNMGAEELIRYINADNVYRECEFCQEMALAFAAGAIVAESIDYKMFEVTGFGRASAPPGKFLDIEHKREGRVLEPNEGLWLRRTAKDGYANGGAVATRRYSWGDPSTWMTGHFGKPGTILIETAEDSLSGNGLLSFEAWLGSVCHKIPINLYIEIRNTWELENDDHAGQFGYFKKSYIYSEEEVWITDKDEALWDFYIDCIGDPDKANQILMKMFKIDEETALAINMREGHRMTETGVFTGFKTYDKDSILLYMRRYFYEEDGVTKVIENTSFNGRAVKKEN